MSTSFWRPFLVGAVASASAILITQQWYKRSKRQEGKERLISPRSFDVEKKEKKEKKSNDDQKKLMDSPYLDQRMVRKAEGAIRLRTSRLTVVVERCTNDHNYSAILRTAEALGVQNVWIICPPKLTRGVTEEDEEEGEGEEKENGTVLQREERVMTMKGRKVKLSQTEKEERRLHHLYAQRALEWLTVREFDTTTDCLKELRATGHAIWATDLSQEAVCLTKEFFPELPPKLAIVFGTEAVGCTQEMLRGADKRVYLPLRGFADSLNLSVATALVIHQLFIMDPDLEGSMSEEERRELRRVWFSKLASQRLLTKGQKRVKAKLTSQLKRIEDTERKQRNGKRMHKLELDKMTKKPDIVARLNELEGDLVEQSRLAVQDLVDSPPDPITDMRRADEHRTCFVGKGTKAQYDGIWDDMPATTGYNTRNAISTSDYFRSRLNGAPDNETEGNDS